MTKETETERERERERATERVTETETGRERERKHRSNFPRNRRTKLIYLEQGGAFPFLSFDAPVIP